MANSGLLICSFYLKKRFSQGDKYSYALNQAYEYNDDEKSYLFNNIFEMFEAFCFSHAEFSDDEKNQKLFSILETSVDRKEKSTYSVLSFTVRAGTYGVEADMTNRHTKKVNYRKSADDADVKDFKCLIYIPKDVDDVDVNKGILIFQSISSYGVKSVTTEYMKRFFSELGLTMEIRSVSVRTFVEKLLEKGRVKEITLIKNKVSSDSSDNIFITKGREKHTYQNPVMKENWIKGFLNHLDKTKTEQMYEIEDVCYEDISLTFKLGDNTRTVRLKYLDRFSVVEDIPDDIYKNGKYNEKELITYMINVAESYKEKMVFQVKSGD